MKLAVWIHTLAVILTVGAITALGATFGNILFHSLHGKPLPIFTTPLINNPWLLTISIPWLIAASWLSRENNLSHNRCIGFMSISVLAIVFLFAYSALAFSLPFVRIMVSFKSPPLP